jgi:hypothetical protein
MISGATIAARLLNDQAADQDRSLATAGRRATRDQNCCVLMGFAIKMG